MCVRIVDESGLTLVTGGVRSGNSSNHTDGIYRARKIDCRESRGVGMKHPRSELRADAEERTEAPDFDALTPPEELVRGDRTRDDRA